MGIMIWSSSSSAIGSWAGPLLDTVSIFGTSSTEDEDNDMVGASISVTSSTDDEDSDMVGALGDGELGGFKSGYLQV